MTTVLVSAVTGLISGAIASLIAPWVQWAIEKRRNLINYRRELIKTWRNELEDYNYVGGEVRASSTYAAIRPHLQQQVRERLENRERFTFDSRGGDTFVIKNILLDEVARIEKEWGLV